MKYLIKNACVYTGVSGSPWAEAIAIDGSSVACVGDSGSCSDHLPGAREIDAQGMLVLPAFNDTHTHFLIGSQSLLEVDLSGVTSRAGFRRLTREHIDSLEDGQWLAGGYWNDEHWAGEGPPDKSWLEDLTGGRPAILYRHDLHQSLCNTAALRAAGFDDASADPPGGTLGRYPDGKLNGLVFEKAMTMVRKCIPAPDQQQVDAVLTASIKHANSLGITAATDMIDSIDVVDQYRRFCGEEHKGVRFELCIPLPERSSAFDAGFRFGQQWGFVALGPMKGFMDGSLGSRTAYMKEPYADDAKNRGYLLDMANPPEKMLAMISEASERGFPSAVHAIGTEAVHVLLHLFALKRASSRNPGLRHRIEHAQHIMDEDISAFHDHKLMASMQPAHLIDDGNVACVALGKEGELTSYRCNSLLQSSATLLFNTDWPVVGLDPLAGIHAAVNRTTSNGLNPEGWLPHEKVSVQQAVNAYTAVPAFANHAENRYGRLQPGFAADLVFLDKNIFTCHPSEISQSRVALTMANGEIVYER